MRGGMDFGQVIEGDVGVELGGLQALMTEEGLDDADISPALEHVGGAGVAEQVAGAGSFEVGFLEQALDAGGERASAEASSLSGEEQRGFVGIVLQEWTTLLAITRDPGQGAGSQRHEAILLAFDKSRLSPADCAVRLRLCGSSPAAASPASGPRSRA